ncbi:MAG TPA: enolase C-terminal domain-like protein [Gemmatimonadaceae bacterium]
MRSNPAIERIAAEAYRIPTAGPEADGTHRWTSTTLVVVHSAAGGTTGVGYSYGSAAMVPLIQELLAPVIVGRDALSVEGAWWTMVREVRNVGRPGIAATAISAIDASLWDLKARLFDLPLATLLGAVRDSVPVYGSGGFTNLTIAELQDQLGQWASEGIGRVKMKVGTAPDEDVARVRAVRQSLGDGIDLMVDANGAYSRWEADAKARQFAELRVAWFEEPVGSDDLDGLRWLRDRSPAGLAVAAGEYGYDTWYFRRMLETGAVDILQADATRCLGISGFLATGRLCEAFHVPLSAHTAPAIHTHVACCMTPVVHIEYFHDHVRIEEMLFDGFQHPTRGSLTPDLTRPGLGFEFKAVDAADYAVREFVA